MHRHSAGQYGNELRLCWRWNVGAYCCLHDSEMYFSIWSSSLIVLWYGIRWMGKGGTIIIGGEKSKGGTADCVISF